MRRATAVDPEELAGECHCREPVDLGGVPTEKARR